MVYRNGNNPNNRKRKEIMMQHRRRLAIFQAAKRASFTGKPVAPTTPKAR